MSVELTERESEVLVLLAEGLHYKQMAVRLEITVSTVRTHLQNIYRKLDVHNGAQAIAVTARVQVRVKRPPALLARPASDFAETAPFLHAYLKLWEQAGSPVPHLVDLDYAEIPARRRKAMHVALAMHLRLRDD